MAKVRDSTATPAAGKIKSKRHSSSHTNVSEASKVPKDQPGAKSRGKKKGQIQGGPSSVKSEPAGNVPGKNSERPAKVRKRDPSASSGPSTKPRPHSHRPAAGSQGSSPNPRASTNSKESPEGVKLRKNRADLRRAPVKSENPSEGRRRRVSSPPRTLKNTQRPISTCVEVTEEPEPSRLPETPTRTLNKVSPAPEELERRVSFADEGDGGGLTAVSSNFAAVLLQQQLENARKVTEHDWAFNDVAFCCFHQTTWPRSWLLAFIKNPWFDRVTMMVIFINCLTLAMYRPCSDAFECGTRCQALKYIDHVIFGYFALEMVIKMFAMGVFGGRGYLSDNWNRLDFFIVMAGTAEYALKSTVGDLNLTVIRTIRVLRPLRAVHRVPQLRILVTILLDSLPMLGDVLLLCFFVFFVFGIVGVQLWNGLLRQRCVPGFFVPENRSPFPEPGYYVPDYPDESEYVCTAPKDAGLHTCVDLPPTLNNKTACNGSIFDDVGLLNDTCINFNQYYNACKATLDNPFGGAISFDNIFYSLLTVFVVLATGGTTSDVAKSGSIILPLALYLEVPLFGASTYAIVLHGDA